MRWSGSGRSVGAGRGSFIAACALAAVVAGQSPRLAWAEPGAVPASADYGNEQRADELYRDGLEKVAGGHSDFARETFESVIAHYPSTTAAENARRQLGSLDSGSMAEADTRAPFDFTVPMTGSLNAPTLGETPDAPTAEPAHAPSWDRELRRNASIQSKMRVEAGDRVFFAPGSAELGSRARTALGAQAQWLIRWHEFEAAIEGHADEPGSEEENIVLSQQRAEAVRERLIEEGVDPSRLAVVPLGRSLRIATCADTDCRAQNRRAVTLVFATGTRERLGLVSSSPLSAALANPAATPTVRPAAATTAAAVGVTR